MSNNHLKVPFLHELSKVVHDLSLFDKTCLVGGIVRDIFLGIETTDVDIAVEGDPFYAGKKFAQYINGSFVKLHEKFKTARVIKGKRTFDFTELQGGSIEADLMRRDFTINSMALPLTSIYDNPGELKQYVTDPSNGMDDIEKGVLRMTNRESMNDDPLRILRAFRFHAELKFKIEEKTLKTIKELSSLMERPSVERIVYELKRILGSENSFETVRLMADCRVFFHLLPEYGEKLFSKPLKGFQAVLFKGTESIINKPAEYLPFHKNFIDYTCKYDFRVPLIKLSSLIMETACNHREACAGEDDSLQRAESMCKRLKLSGRERSLLLNLLSYRSKILEAEKLCKNKKELIALLKAINEDLYGAIISGSAFVSVNPDEWSKEKCKVFFDSVEKIAAFYCKIFIPLSQAGKLISGRDLTESFNLTPSPLFKEIIDHIEVKVMTGEIVSKKEALREVERILK